MSNATTRAPAACPGSARVPRAGERVLAIADFSLDSHLSAVAANETKDCFGATPLRLRSGQASPACERRALPGISDVTLIIASRFLPALTRATLDVLPQCE